MCWNCGEEFSGLRLTTGDNCPCCGAEITITAYEESERTPEGELVEDGGIF